MKPKSRTRGRAVKLGMTHEHYKLAKDYGTVKQTPGGYQSAFAEITRLTRKEGGGFVTVIYDDDLTRLKTWAAREDNGSYQRWARDVLEANGIEW